MTRYFAAFIFAALWFSSVSNTYGYEVIKVKNGAILRGTVEFEGGVPQDEIISITKDIDYCGKKQKTGKYLVSDSRVKNVVLWIEGIKKGKSIPEKPVDVGIRKCRAVPHVNIGYVGGKYVFRSDDDIFHTVQLKLGLAYQKRVSRRPLKDGATIYNLALPIRSLLVEKSIKKWHRYSEETGFIQVMSNTHNWIRGYIFIFDHPYAAITDEKGRFEIDNLPPGEYLLKAWHEGFGMKEKKISVQSGKTVEVEIAFAQ
jgi:hypothetical protein